MGCDIHLYKEKLVDGKWVTADEWEPYDYGDDDKGIEVPWKKRFTDRNYNLFGALAKGVRCEHPFSFAPRGMPMQSSPEYRETLDKWGVDGHNTSYLYLHELRELREFCKTSMISISGMKDHNELAALRASIESGTPDWKLLFPYCGWTNDPRSVEFTIDVPADFYLGSGLDSIIGSFDGVDGDNHRIVFFFDN